jgi:argininosuccinate synthase
VKKILLAYSGGLDTSCILTWLKEKFGAPVVAYCCDVGQKEDLEEVRRKAMRTGAVKCLVEDRREEFARDYVFTAVKANALYEGVYYMGTSLARPCIGQGMVEAALREGCDAVAHGSTGKGNDQVRFELAVKALAPQLRIIAPWRDWEFKGRNDLFDYAKKHSIPLPVTAEKPYSMDANLMHISYEGGVLEDPWAEPPRDIFRWTRSPEQAPDRAETVEIEFASGAPVALNGKNYPPAQLLAKANDLGALHGIGRVDCVENRYIGIKSRGVYETPGATLLMQAHRGVESLALDREVAHLKDQLVTRFAELVYNGYWFSPEMDLLRKFIDETQTVVNGVARLRLFKGSSILVGRKSPDSLYSPKLSSFDDMQAFSPADSGGFININGLRLSTWSKIHARTAKGVPASARPRRDRVRGLRKG